MSSRTRRSARPTQRWTRVPLWHHGAHSCSGRPNSHTPSPENRSVCSVGPTPLLGPRYENVTQAWPVRNSSPSGHHDWHRIVTCLTHDQSETASTLDWFLELLGERSSSLGLLHWGVLSRSCEEWWVIFFLPSGRWPENDSDTEETGDEDSW